MAVDSIMDQKTLKRYLKYIPETGEFIRLTGRNKGMDAGGRYVCGNSGQNYIRIRIGPERSRYVAHRLAFLYMTGEWPKGVVDHVNHNGMDNRWSNLRDVTKSENNRNTGGHVVQQRYKETLAHG